jgi:hypothetical protein
MRFTGLKRMCALGILLSFCGSLGFGAPPKTQRLSSPEKGTPLWSESEVDALIEDLTTAAEEAIAKAAGEAAKAASIASLEREAKALADLRKAKKSKLKTALITGAVCFFGGVTIGVTGTILIGGR